MLTLFGVDYQTSGDTLRIEGRKELLPCTIDAHHDHRIAMAAAIGALATVGAVTIEGAEAVNKSYPDFFRHYEQLNGTVTIQL
jgi:3-phosphoshikimate 1-carboxyvinyltransferase